MNFLSKLFARSFSPDPWFWSHYDGAAKKVLSVVPPQCFGKGKKIVDFGCGDGAITLGVSSNIKAEITGIDLTQAFQELPIFSQKNLGTRKLPANISFEQTYIGKPLPFPDCSIDLVYSWSVFEHVSDVKGILADLNRITKPGGFIFIQIEPLFYGPYGSHLQRLVNQPWLHLLHSEEEYLRIAASASDEVPQHEQDALYRNNAFEDVKRYLLGEYKSLNKIKADELIKLVSESGFDISSATLIKVDNLVPDERLLEKYSLDLLLTNEIILLAQKTLIKAH